MSSTGSEYRLDGIYRQRQDSYFMQRIKLPAGVLSASQARTIATIATRCGQGSVHLTTRGSMEIHWLREKDLPWIKRELAKSGLTSRGACGGAVRGITCGSQGAEEFPVLETVVRRLQRHFTGNPRFERLPKKFKIGIEANVDSGRHLIQDAGLVLTRLDAGRAHFDIWIAGGLGREPQPGFLLTEHVAEERIIPIIEAIVSVYAAYAPPPKRLKFLAREFGTEKLRQLIEAEAVYREELPSVTGLPEYIVTDAIESRRLELPVFAGKLTAKQLQAIADYAEHHADGVLMVTANQDLALQLTPESSTDTEFKALLQSTGLDRASVPALRVCPGSHECLMGLAATRDIAQHLVQHISAEGHLLSWAISGCPNSCSQPQLADAGIVATHLVTGDDGIKSPRFAIYRRKHSGLGEKVHEGLTHAELEIQLARIT